MLDDGETIDFCDPCDDVFGDCNDLTIDGSFLDELLKGTHACTHTHTCNPPGPSNTPHTHTCVHTHTHLFAQQEEGHTTTGHSETLKTLNRTDSLKSSEHLTLESSETHTLIGAETLEDPTSSEKKRPLGNREAVKKYREKKKAHTAYLEEEILQLRTLNQQLVKRLQGQAALEAEVFRLRNLLSEFRGRIDGELGLLHKKDPGPLPGGYVLNSFSVPCGGADVPCLHPSVEKKRVSSTSHDPSIAAGSVFSCEKASARCKKNQGSRKRQAGKIGSVADMADCIREG